MERVINTDNCMVCGVQLNYSRNELTMLLNFSQKPIYSLIGKFYENHSNFVLIFLISHRGIYRHEFF